MTTLYLNILLHLIYCSSHFILSNLHRKQYRNWLPWLGFLSNSSRRNTSADPQMADHVEKPTRPRGNTDGTASRPVSRQKSRPSDALHRVVSGNYLDDHSQYHGHNFYGHPHEEADNNDDDDDDIREKDNEEAAEPDGEGSSEDSMVDEVRDGIKDESDVEAGPHLTKTKSSKSAKSAQDPNLVKWAGPNDPDNPKNWKRSRKWAATLVSR